MIPKYPVLSSSGRQVVVVRGAEPAWPAGQATRYRMAATR